MQTQAYLFRLLRRGTTITTSNVISCPFWGKVLVEVGLIGTGHVVGGEVGRGINVDEHFFQSKSGQNDDFIPRFLFLQALFVSICTSLLIFNEF
jgi:hypothetical protein